eukprot:5031094-Pleurochrysis_carterae.AAC.1
MEDVEPADPPPASRKVRTAPPVPWPFISLMANAILFTALVTAGVILSLQNGNGGQRTAALRVSQSLIAIAV